MDKSPERVKDSDPLTLQKADITIGSMGPLADKQFSLKNE